MLTHYSVESSEFPIVIEVYKRIISILKNILI